MSLTPLRLDLTDEEHLADLAAWRPLDWPLAAVASPSISSPDAAEAVRKDEAAAPVVP